MTHEAADAPALPWSLGGFELTERLGESAVGTMYRAHHRDFGRTSHVRILGRVYTRDAEAVRIVLEDVYGRTPVVHRNVGGGCMYIPEIGRGQVDGVVFLVCSPANRLDLETLVRRLGPLPWAQARALMLAVCRGLDAAHRAGLVHGDLQAGHCFVIEGIDETVHGLLRVTGFGLAAARRRALLAGDRGAATPSIAPEQVAGEPASVRSDVYAAGALLLHLLRGEPPRACPEHAAVYRIEGEIPPTWPVGAPALLEVALAPDPAARHATIREFAAALAAVDGGDVAAAMASFDRPPTPVERSPTDWALIARLIVFAGVVLFALLYGK